MTSLLWQRDDELKALATEQPNDLHEVFFVKVSVGRIGGTFRTQQYPAADVYEADTKARTLMQGYRDSGFTFLGRGDIDKRKRTYSLQIAAADMDDPLKPSAFDALARINGAFARRHVS